MRPVLVSLVSSFIAVAAVGGAASADPYDYRGSYGDAAGGVLVYSGDNWYPAQVLEVSGQSYLVHYDGTGSESDEWVDASRVQGAGGATAGWAPIVAHEPAAQIYWGNQWYDGQVLGVRGGRYHVRYRGNDEWVDAGRLHLHARGHGGHGWSRPSEGRGGHAGVVGHGGRGHGWNGGRHGSSGERGGGWNGGHGGSGGERGGHGGGGRGHR